MLDAGHPAMRSASHAFLRRGLERASEIDQALTAREQELVERGFEPPVAHVRGLSTVFRYGDHTRSRIPIADASRIHADVELEPNVVLRPVAERAILPTSRTWEDPARSRISRRRPPAEALGAVFRSWFRAGQEW